MCFINNFFPVAYVLTLYFFSLHAYVSMYVVCTYAHVWVGVQACTYHNMCVEVREQLQVLIHAFQLVKKYFAVLLLYRPGWAT